MTDIVTTVNMYSEFDRTSKHAETLENISRAMQQAEPNHRREAILSLITAPVELGYSGGPLGTR